MAGHSDFATPEQVERHIARILPDEAIRTACLSIFAESAERLHRQGPAHWGAYCEDAHLRLRGGGLIVLTIGGGRIWLALDQAEIDSSESAASLLRAPGVAPDLGRWAHYNRPRTTNIFYTPTAESASVWPRIRPLHFALLDRVAQRALRPESRNKHQPAVGICLGMLLQRSFPEPAYHSRAPRIENAIRDEARPRSSPPPQAQGDGSSQYWWFGVNNGSEGHVALKDVQHILDDDSSTFSWPIGNSRPKTLYGEMRPGDHVLLWTGHNKSPRSEPRWGLLGTAMIQSVHPDHVVLGGGKRFAAPITPYPRGNPQASAEVCFLRDTFGIDFKPLGDVMCAVFGAKRQSPVTVCRVSEASFQAVLAFVRDAARSAGSPGHGGREQATLKRESLIPAELEEPTADPNELDLRVRHLRKLRSIERPKGEQVPARSTVGTRTLYVRNPIVKAWVLQKACGRCELCQQEAPFVGDDGEPYLELHHVLPLADGGADTVENAVALCPNCHRRLHHAVDRSEHREHLYRQVSRLIRAP